MLRIALLRKFATSAKSALYEPKFSIFDHHLQINGINLSFSWLRDHCRSAANYDLRNHQRRFEVPQETTLVSCCQVDDDKFEILWRDGFKSTYSVSAIAKIFKNQGNDARYEKAKLWTSREFPNMIDDVVPFNDYMSSASGLRKALEQIWIYGFAIVSGAPISSEHGTRIVAERLGPIFRGTFGDLWEFGRDAKDNVSDSAYSNVALGVHTDATYMSQALGIQVFHCLKEAENGGESILADGFKIAHDFRLAHPEGFHFFATTPVEAEYIHTATEPHVHYFNSDVIFKTYKDSHEMKQIRLNAYDRAPHNMDLETQLKFYDFYGKLIQMAKEDKYSAKFKLHPGQVLLANNWRLLHGRASFEGERIMSGCYISHDDFMSASRTMLLGD